MKKFVVPVLVLLAILSCKKDDWGIPSVVINEVMPVNSYTAMDQNNEFDDWVELYNNTSSSFDLSGYYLTDNRNNLTKWKFPSGTSIASKSYLIVWTDGDSLQSGLHTNFKLSSDGEKIFLVNRDKLIADEVKYPAQTAEATYSRVPDGTGVFQWKAPSFNTSNN